LAVLAAILLTGPTRSSEIRLGARWLPVLGGAAVAGVFLAAPTQGLLGVVAVCSGAGAAWLVRRRQQRAQIRATSVAVELLCRELADDLRMGRLPAEALSDGAERWPPLMPVVVAAQFDHDVPGAIREVSRVAGAEGLRDLAAAWEVSARAGSGLAESLDQVGRLLAARQRRARLVAAELAAARATALVVSGLPLLVLAMGSGLGTSPWAFFLTGAGSADLATGGTLLFAGWAWLDRLASQAERR